MDTLLLSTPEAARFLGISRRTLEKWRLTGGGPAYHKFGSRVLYGTSDLAEWAATRKRNSTSDPGCKSQRAGN
ncbi:MAG: helix-turn-helix domain-containing protein [Proteobacteria bacterium]|nr:helix-turn-helix domain-containing protein [Pseudomonadota bacterium]